MTPREKAKELVDKHRKWVNQIEGSYSETEYAKKSALITVEEILKVVSFYNDSQAEVIYFKEVKSEIEKI